VRIARPQASPGCANQGWPYEPRTMLAEIYSWFTEGFDTADLKHAKALLDELSGAPARERLSHQWTVLNLTNECSWSHQ
jgi:hypothetical protein